MNDFNDYFEEHDGQINTFGHFAAINQRNKQIQQQRENAEALRKQTAALEKQNKIEKNRARIEEQRLQIERQRIEMENAEREMRGFQNKKVKELRNLIVESTLGLESFRKRFLS